MLRNQARFLAVIACLHLFGICTIAVASDQSYQMILRGFDQLQLGNDQAAFELFRAATDIDSRDGQGFLFAGTALNQLGKYSEALNWLNKARELGDEDPELLFQTGRAQLGIAEYSAAVKSLLTFELKKPGRGQTQEFLGRAYLARGDFRKADVAFREALRRDPELRSTVLPAEAELCRLQNDQQSAWQNLDDLQWYAPNSATARLLHVELFTHGALVGQSGGDISPLKFSVSISGGYNSDVRGIEVVDVAGNTSGRSSGFDQTGLSASYSWTHLTPTMATQSPDQFTVGGSVSLDDYPKATEGDFLAAVGSLEYDRPVYGPFSTSLKLFNDYDSLGWRGFRERIAGRAAVQWRLNDRLVLEPAYTAAHDDYLYDAPPVQNPDAVSHTFSLDGYITLSPADAATDRAVACRVGGFYVINQSEGADFDYHGGGVVAGLDFPLVEHVRAQLLYTWSEDRYLNLNSLTINPADIILQRPTARRNDFSNSISIRFNRQMREVNRHLTIFAGYDYTRNNSNISAYEFSQHIVSLGLNWDM